MEQNKDIIPIITFEKGNVKGYFEHRGGKLVWINPYSNEKQRHKRVSPGRSTDVRVKTPTARRRLPKEYKTSKKQKITPLYVNHGTNEEPFNFILPVIIKIVDTINSFEDGEIARLRQVLFTCKVIIKELGYMDEGLESVFTSPDVKPTRLSGTAERKTSGMFKTVDELSKRPLSSALKHKLERLANHFEDAL